MTGEQLEQERAETASMTREELAEARKSMKLTQAQLGTILRVASPSNPGKKVGQWERGVHRVPPYLDLALCEVRRRLKIKS